MQNKNLLSLLDASKSSIAPDNTDFNDVLGGTVYATVSTSNPLHLPDNVDKGGLVYTIRVSCSYPDYRMQVYFPAYNFPYIRYRYYYNNGWVWSDWKAM